MKIMLIAKIVYQIDFTDEQLRALIRMAKAHYSKECIAAGCRVGESAPGSTYKSELNGFLTINLDRLECGAPQAWNHRELDILHKITEMGFLVESETVRHTSRLVQQVIRQAMAAGSAAQAEWTRTVDISTTIPAISVPIPRSQIRKEAARAADAVKPKRTKK